ncbi:MAG: hypothetical protein INR65_11075, partial [Gluconacetobacter diazotrophicus]|nr:hypothetical protein [Gluconacetobacter diazotrophicus]
MNGTQAYSLAQAYASAVNNAAASGTLGAVGVGGNGTGPTSAPGSAVNELVATSGGFFTYASGFDHFTTQTTDRVFVDASGTTSSSINALIGTGGATFLAGSASGTFIFGGGQNTFIGGTG